MISLAVIFAEIIFSCRCYLGELLDDYYMVFVIIMSVLYFLFPAIFSNTISTSSSTMAPSSLISSQAGVYDKKAVIVTSESCVNEENLLRNTARRILKLSKKKVRTWKKNGKVTVPLHKRVFVISIGKQAQEILLH